MIIHLRWYIKHLIHYYFVEVYCTGLHPRIDNDLTLPYSLEPTYLKKKNLTHCRKKHSFKSIFLFLFGLAEAGKIQRSWIMNGPPQKKYNGPTIMQFITTFPTSERTLRPFPKKSDRAIFILLVVATSGRRRRSSYLVKLHFYRHLIARHES